MAKASLNLSNHGCLSSPKVGLGWTRVVKFCPTVGPIHLFLEFTGQVHLVHLVHMQTLILSVCPGLILFCIFIFYVIIDVLWKGMVKSFLLSKEEPLTLKIDKLWGFEFLKEGPKIRKEIGENWTS